MASERRTLVFFCSPHRVEADAAALLEGMGDRPAALVRELTKLHEEVRRGTLSELVSGLESDPARGEVVLVVSGAIGEHRQAPPPEDLARRARELMDAGVARKDALIQVAGETGVSRRDVFDALIEKRGG